MTYVELIRTYNQADVALIRSLLQSEEILHYVHGERFSLLRPFLQPARIMVAEDRIEEARELISQIRPNIVPLAGIHRTDSAE